MNKSIFKIALICMTFSILAFSQNSIAQNTDGHSKTNKEHRKGPPGGKPPRGGSPEQTETQSEMKGYKLGDTASDFSLKNVDGKMISLASFKDAKGYIVTFTCNECPFSKMYEDRLIALNNEYAPKGYPIIAINPNSSASDSEGYAAMQKRAKEKGFTFPYLADDDQNVFPKFGALRTPHVFILDQDLTVKYIGTIDDNARSADDAKVNYVVNAIKSLEKGTEISPNFTKAIGCPVKPVSKK